MFRRDPAPSLMKTQKDIFTEGEADAWWQRNRAGLAQFDANRDVVIRHLRPYLRPGMSVAEVGCSMAGRVAGLVQLTGGVGFGIDPSPGAIVEAKKLYPNLIVASATADALPWAADSIDVLIYGFCLYLCDRADLFRIAAEGDRVLKSGGLLAVLDFSPPLPYRNDYTHKPGVLSYKMDHAQLWRWNPAYVEISREIFDHQSAQSPGDSTFAPDERTAVAVLRKLPAYAYPHRPEYDQG
jgi:ubiquinone/menaquinone biosynthesis C-methylase UbiE